MADDCHMHVLMPATRNLRQFIKRNSLFLKQAINNCWLFSSGFPNTHMHLTMYTYNNAYNIYSLHRYFFLSSFHFSCSRLKYNRSIVFRACVVSSIAESLWFAFCFFLLCFCSLTVCDRIFLFRLFVANNIIRAWLCVAYSLVFLLACCYHYSYIFTLRRKTKNNHIFWINLFMNEHKNVYMARHCCCMQMSLTFDSQQQFHSPPPHARLSMSNRVYSCSKFSKCSTCSSKQCGPRLRHKTRTLSEKWQIALILVCRCGMCLLLYFHT